MKVILTTVKQASVSINQKMIASIQKGMLLLVGFCDGDNQDTVDLMVDKILKLRVFCDENRQINLSISDVGGDILSVSQFTLYANTSKGRRPSFIDALNPRDALNLYEYFNARLELLYKTPSTGIFGAFMDVNSINEGPFTLILDSSELWPK